MTLGEESKTVRHITNHNPSKDFTGLVESLLYESGAMIFHREGIKKRS